MEGALKCEWTLSGSKALYWTQRHSSRGYARCLHGIVSDPPDHCSTFKKIEIESRQNISYRVFQQVPDHNV